MAFSLGKDGRIRALQINTGEVPTSVTTVYVGLLTTMPANAATLNLSTIVANEFPINANFYTGRQAITFGTMTNDSSGSRRNNNNSTPLAWTNTTGSTITVGGIFLTDAASTGTGLSLWIGPPDPGTATIFNTNQARVNINDLLLGVA
jgi:hypothetical protein